MKSGFKADLKVKFDFSHKHKINIIKIKYFLHIYFKFVLSCLTFGLLAPFFFEERKAKIKGNVILIFNNIISTENTNKIISLIGYLKSAEYCIRVKFN
jgi:hypothetical protein